MSSSWTSVSSRTRQSTSPSVSKVASDQWGCSWWQQEHSLSFANGWWNFQTPHPTHLKCTAYCAGKNMQTFSWGKQFPEHWLCWALAEGSFYHFIITQNKTATSFSFFIKFSELIYSPAICYFFHTHLKFTARKTTKNFLNFILKESNSKHLNSRFAGINYQIKKTCFIHIHLNFSIFCI